MERALTSKQIKGKFPPKTNSKLQTKVPVFHKTIVYVKGHTKVVPGPWLGQLWLTYGDLH